MMRRIQFDSYDACSWPGIAQQPVPNTPIQSGGSTTLFVTATGGSTTPLTYQWFKDGSTTPIEGATGSSLNTGPLTSSATYKARIINSCGRIDSDIAAVTLCGDPAITSQPQSQTIASGTRATLSVGAAGCPPVSYQWYRGAAPDISAPEGGNSTSYTTPALTATAQYWVRVTDVSGSVNSTTATVTVCAAPAITSQPQNQSIASGGSATLTVAASGCTPLSYQWYRGVAGDTSAPEGGNSTSHTTPALTATTQYWVRVTNVGGSINSMTATITVCAPPTITSHPQNQTIASGGSATLSVVASGCSLSYQWYRVSGDTSAPVGSNSTSFTTPALTATTRYWVRVTDSFSTSVNSITAVVTVPLAMPGPLVATLTGTNQITVAWGASPGADHYELHRLALGTWEIQPVYATSRVDNCQPNTTYVYQVRAVDAVGGSESPYTERDLATTMSFALVQTNGLILFSHFDQVLGAVNAVRGASGQGALSWSQALTEAGYPGEPAPQQYGPIKGRHLLALRSRMNAALQAVQVPTLAYTDDLSTPAVIRALHVVQLQLRAQ